MAILITGDEGFIGSRLRAAFKSNQSVVGIDFKNGLDLLSCHLPEVKLIYHLAAQSSVESSWKDPVHDMDNLKMTARLVKRYPKARIVYANSAAALSPISSPYGFSKWASAEYIKTFHKDYIICTFPNIYGGTKSVVDIFKGKDRVIVYGDGKQTRDYVHVDDIVNGLLKAARWDIGEYQMGSGVATSVLELAHGKEIYFGAERKEARESVLRNDTPDWKAKINVHEYLSN